MTQDLTVRLEWDGGGELEWTIDRVTDAPEGRYLLLDTDGEPRLVVTGSERAQFQRGGFQ